MAVNFIGNLGTRKIHSVIYADGRCKLDKIKEENKVSFTTLDEGFNYPSAERRIFTPCNICITKFREATDGTQK